MYLYLIRHGDPNYALDCLTERGKLQAEAVAKRLQHAGITQVYSSPMGRAIETAQPTCDLLGLPLHIEPWAHEIPSKQMTSQTFPNGDPTVLFKVQNTRYMENGNYDIPFSQWETAPGFRESDIAAARKEIVEGGRDFLARLGYREENGVYRIENPNEERVALFCHGCFLFTWISELLHIPLQVSWGSLSFTHTGITILRFTNNADGVTNPRCLCTSDTSHLYAHGPDTKYNGGNPI